MTPYDVRDFFNTQRDARDWEPLERMVEDVYRENPLHGRKGHRVSRHCDQCVENAS